MSIVVVQVIFTPFLQLASPAQLAHGALPKVEKVAAFTHATGGLLHTVSIVLVQTVLTPWVHVATAAHAAHGALPEAEKVAPVTHAGVTDLHERSFVVVQAVLTPWVQVVKCTFAGCVAGVQVAHGVLPEVEKVAPATHVHLSAAQSVFERDLRRVKAVLLFQASAIRRLLHEVRAVLV